MINRAPFVTKAEFGVLKADVGVLKADVAALKADIQLMKLLMLIPALSPVRRQFDIDFTRAPAPLAPAHPAQGFEMRGRELKL